ncbi:Antibiotic biosynthesis monooxygenase [Rhodobacteraceae bacterium THAF1]|uniref:putative quinol monooxygenase n=1 Tax=Palleronia sp. THAF1 TaxID=2587842 RepID=UPI000F410F50|nr:putative quinol monooxygenase [Palleronia sp. THAF1]QFU07930.1 Antibiotic biosynthesis monooxygenase [Palleronia sp. THAF1]VDC25764.1 Antibiotic biosynthesis monooxygenase [Rhodobacteraceae bacterium THAF1]
MRTFVTAVFTAKKGHEAELEELFKSVIAPTMKDKGCVSYALNRAQDDPRRFVFMEEWESREDLEAHLAADHITNGLAKAGALIEHQDITILERIGGGDAADA